MTRQLKVKVVFGNRNTDSTEHVSIDVDEQGNDSLRDIKENIARCLGGQLSADDILLSFGPVDRKLGRQFRGDPMVDERALLLKDFSVLGWMERFPHWHLSVSLLPDTPPPPGVAIKKAAAMAEKKDPDQAVEEGRRRGDIPKIDDLPAPWGPKKHEEPPREELMSSGYIPATYPEGSAPMVDATMVDCA